MSSNLQNKPAMDTNQLIQQRTDKLDAMRQQGFAFPNDFRRDVYAKDLQQRYADWDKPTLEAAQKTVKVAGRIMLNRGAFLALQDGSGRIQLYVNRKILTPDVLAQIKTWDLGDIVGVEGVLARSGRGDLYVDMRQVYLLTKALRPLPEKHKGLVDTEQRYRQRYVDLMTNEDARQVFKIRSGVIHHMRCFMHDNGFVEAETPMLQSIPGGATARPFVTHHNALDQAMYLRIAPELFLKRLVVGGMEQVFEINRNFRNEGLSTRHNPEFTMLEFYWAYRDYQDLMDFTEQMLRHLAQSVLGSTLLQNRIVNEAGETIDTLDYDLGAPFIRMSLKEAIVHYGEGITSDALDDEAQAKALAQEQGIAIKPTWGLGRVQTELFEQIAEPNLLQPTFITHYPAEVSPLARRNDNDPFVTDRFEFFIGGRELANGFSELNDAQDQHQRFMAQVSEKDAGDNEAMHYDADYIRALEYGLPPTAGEGIGIDRLVMLFADVPSIRDVILFPAMRHEKAID